MADNRCIDISSNLATLDDRLAQNDTTSKEEKKETPYVRSEPKHPIEHADSKERCTKHPEDDIGTPKAATTCSLAKHPSEAVEISDEEGNRKIEEAIKKALEAVNISLLEVVVKISVVEVEGTVVYEVYLAFDIDREPELDIEPNATSKIDTDLSSGKIENLATYQEKVITSYALYRDVYQNRNQETIDLQKPKEEHLDSIISDSEDWIYYVSNAKPVEPPPSD